VTHEYRVEGPVAILLTTTSVEIDEELLNRCLVLTVDEGREQTRAIHREQRERRTLEGYLARQDRHEIRAIHQDAQRLLEPLPILNPWARRLDFVDGQTRTRRDNEKYLTLIDAIALLHQHQRARKEAVRRTGEKIEHLEVSLEDIEAANRLAHEILGHSLDELPPQTRRLLSQLDRWVGDQCGVLEIDRVDFRFTTRQVREVTSCGQTQLRIHLARLVELEYLIQHRAQRGQYIVYELVYDGGGEDGKPFVARLLDVEKLRAEMRVRQPETGLSPIKTELEASRTALKRGQNGAKTAPKRGQEIESKALVEEGLEDSEEKTSEKALIPPVAGNHVVLESAVATQSQEAA
jgi:DNA primase